MVVGVGGQGYGHVTFLLQFLGPFSVLSVHYYNCRVRAENKTLAWEESNGEVGSYSRGSCIVQGVVATHLRARQGKAGQVSGASDRSLHMSRGACSVMAAGFCLLRRNPAGY